MTRLTLMLVAAWLLAACASRPAAMAQTAKAPPAWSQTASRAQTSTPSALPTLWWQVLGDEELNMWVDVALADNADVQVSTARLKQAQALAQAALAARQPDLGLASSAARDRTPKSTVGDADGTATTVPALRQSRFSLQAQARYEVDLLGRLALTEGAAAAELVATVADSRAVKQWLASEVVQAYAELRMAQQRRLTAQSAAALIERLLLAQRQQLGAGLIARDKLRTTERLGAERRDEQLLRQHEQHVALARLALLVGKAPVDVVIAPQAYWTQQITLTGAVPADLPAAVIEQRTDIAAAWQRVLAASQNADRTRLERFPALTLTGSTGFLSGAARRWLTGDALTWLALAALEGPLFDGGRNRAKTDEAKAGTEVLQAQHRKLVLRALGEVESALSAILVSRQRVAHAQAELRRRGADRDAAQAMLVAGTDSRTNLWQAELATLDADAALQSRRHELLLAWAQTYKALGR